VAELAAVTGNVLGVAKVHRKIEPGNFKSVVSLLTRRIIDNRLTGASLPAQEGGWQGEPRGARAEPKS